MRKERRAAPAGLLPVMALYAAAAFVHHAHNAEFLNEYPNLPAWLSPALVYGAWLGSSALGAVGYLLVRVGRRLAGLAVLAVYALLGFGALGHYRLAPLSVHTAGMNVTIWLEAVTAGLLLAGLFRLALKQSPT